MKTLTKEVYERQDLEPIFEKLLTKIITEVKEGREGSEEIVDLENLEMDFYEVLLILEDVIDRKRAEYNLPTDTNKDWERDTDIGDFALVYSSQYNDMRMCLFEDCNSIYLWWEGCIERED